MTDHRLLPPNIARVEAFAQFHHPEDTHAGLFLSIYDYVLNRRCSAVCREEGGVNIQTTGRREEIQKRIGKNAAKGSRNEKVI